MNNLPKIGVPLLILLTVGLLVISRSIVTIGPGEAGVLYRFFDKGVVGNYVKITFYQLN